MPTPSNATGIRGACCRAAALATALLAAHAPAQPPPAPAAVDSSGAAAPAQAAAEDDPYRIFRAPLLREGSTLVEARARLARGGPQEWWVLTLEPAAAPGEPGADASAPPHELIVLPCTRLSEMERIIETAPRDQADGMRFEVSGRVYVFRDRNYLLPTHAVVISAAETVASAPATSMAADAAAAPATGAAPPAAADDDSAEAIARALQQQAGPLARSSARAATQGHAPDRLGTAAGAAASDRRLTLQENTAVVNRRGKITRDRGGGWLLVLDADASGLADPPLKLLPCRLLEDVEDYARRTGNNSPIIITGQVYLYNGQNHLLPTVYRIPRESSRLTP